MTNNNELLWSHALDNEDWEAANSIENEADVVTIDTLNANELKNRFLLQPELIEKVASHIVGCAMSDLKDGDPDYFETEREWQEFVHHTTEIWINALKYIIETPGDEWPEGLATPNIFATALNEVEALEIN